MALARPIPAAALARPARHVAPALGLSLLLHAGLAGVLANYDYSASPGGGSTGEDVSLLVLGDDFWRQTPPAPGADTLPAPEAQPTQAERSQREQQALEVNARPEEPEPETAPDKFVSVGVDDALAETGAMLGSAQQTPHQAMAGGIDQPALALEEGQPGEPGDEPAPPMEPTPSESDAAHPASLLEALRFPMLESADDQTHQQSLDAQRVDADVLAQILNDRPADPVEPAATEPVPTEQQPTLPDLLAIPTPVDAPVDDEFGDERVIETKPPEPTPAPAPAAKELLAVAPPRVEPAATPQQPAQPPPAKYTNPFPARTQAKLSDAEAQAFAKEPSIEFRPGQPLAGKGVRVRTVLPQFAITTQLTRVPRNPTVVIKFNREGKVVGAWFEGEGTGSPDIDEPLMDAIHRWTATGREFARLSAADPNAGVMIKVLYILRD